LSERTIILRVADYASKQRDAKVRPLRLAYLEQLPKVCGPHDQFEIYSDNPGPGERLTGSNCLRRRGSRLAARDIHAEAGLHWIDHRMPIVTVFDTAAPIETMTGTALPDAIPEGTCTLTWYSPIVPGASPENSTLAATPPIVTVGMAMVVDRFVLDDGAPVGSSLPHDLHSVNICYCGSPGESIVHTSTLLRCEHFSLSRFPSENVPLSSNDIKAKPFLRATDPRTADWQDVSAR
jgi:hypothetical protein